MYLSNEQSVEPVCSVNGILGSSKWPCSVLVKDSQPQLKKLKSGSQKRKVKKDRERRQKEGSQVLTNFFSKKGEHKRLNTQDETPFNYLLYRC
jgi:hypothetical protein